MNLNPANIAREMLRLIEKDSYFESSILGEETEVAFRFLDVLKNGVISSLVQIESLDVAESDFEIDCNSDGGDEELVSTEDSQELSDNEDIYRPETNISSNNRVSYGKKVEVVKYWTSCTKMTHKSQEFPRRSFKSMQSRYRWLKNESQLYHFKKEVEQEETDASKKRKIPQLLFDTFTKLRNDGKILCDIDLKHLSYQISKEMGIRRFKASSGWIAKFKNKFRIVSRKVTTFVTKAKFVDQRKIERTIEEYRINFRDRVSIIVQK